MAVPDQPDLKHDVEMQIWDDGLCRIGKTGSSTRGENKILRQSFAMKGMTRASMQFLERNNLSNDTVIVDSLSQKKCKNRFNEREVNNLTLPLEKKNVSVNKNADNKPLEKTLTTNSKLIFGSKLNMTSVSCIDNGRKAWCAVTNSNMITDLLHKTRSQENTELSDVDSLVLSVGKKDKARSAENNNDMETLTNVSSMKTRKLCHSSKTSCQAIETSNYRKLNMKVKRYAKNGRSKRILYMRQRKKQQLINKFKTHTCFRCGEEGHWAQNCTKASANRRSNAASASYTASLPDTTELPCSVSDVLCSSKLSVKHSSPVLQCDDDNQHFIIERGLRHLKFQTFREGQKQVVTRILQGKSTLAILPTGSGKSLCYQLPAYLYSRQEKSVALVISPLVALMNDQVMCLPRGVKGACLHNQMTAREKDKVLADVEAGNVCLLLVSPETVMSCNPADPRCILNRLPAVSFVCIDEVHCIFAWSHNFRPSYLRLCSFLKDECGVKCFLGLTATASMSVSREIAKLLGILEFDSGIICVPYKSNGISLSVSKTKHKDDDLLMLLCGSRFGSCPSIIVYCTRRQETEHVAALVRTCLKCEKVGNFPNWQTATCYHAGMTGEQRKKVQKAFMSGKIRLVAATVAFGMGLNKKDLRGVIHYSMPSNAESYLQEIGRAGRDGGGANCHLFVEGGSLMELQRHIVAHTVDAIVIKKFVEDVFKPCQCQLVLGRCQQLGETARASNKEESTSDTFCRGHERAISIDMLVRALDMPEDSISTLFCYLELHPLHLVKCLRPTYATCRIDCYGGPRQLEAVSRSCPAVGIGLLMAKKTGLWKEGDSSLQMPIIDISDCLGEEASKVQSQLSRLSWSTDKKQTGVKVSYSDLAFHYHSYGKTSAELDDITTYLVNEVTKLESRGLCKLKELHAYFVGVACTNVNDCVDNADEGQSTTIHETLLSFSSYQQVFDVSANVDNLGSLSAQNVQSDIYSFINTYQTDHELTGRMIARIFHGIGSPNYPTSVWSKVKKFWRCHLEADFNQLRLTATLILQQLKRNAHIV